MYPHPPGDVLMVCWRPLLAISRLYMPHVPTLSCRWLLAGNCSLALQFPLDKMPNQCLNVDRGFDLTDTSASGQQVV
jgi:hypothetical protein